MNWVQVREPNLSVRTSLGMCLKYVQDAFGSGWAGSYALQGWRDIVVKKHRIRGIPNGVYVPIWFEGEWDGYNYGHVAIYRDGTVYSSPYSNKTSHDVLGSIAEVERTYGMKYIGWSEDIGGSTVIKEEDMAEKVNLDTARILAHMNLARDGYDGRPSAHGGTSDDDLKKHHVGKELTNKYIRDNFFSSGEASKAFGVKDALYKERDRLRAEVAGLKKQLASAQPGEAEKKLKKIREGLDLE